MKTRRFYTTGNQDIIEDTWDKPEPTDTQIEVKTIITGVCRSDIDMYAGEFKMLPPEIQGHEGIGQITKVGKKIGGHDVGDYVATRGEPAFSDFYNADEGTFIATNWQSYDGEDISADYIIEPVACGVNLVAESIGLKRHKPKEDLRWKFGNGNVWVDPGNDEPSKRILILGSGFLAKVVYATLMENHKNIDITVVGNANQQYWITQPISYISGFGDVENDERFDVIYDISSKARYVSPEVHHLANNGILVVAAEKKPNVAYPTSELLWKSARVVYPSPRSNDFHTMMTEANKMIVYAQLDVTGLWTQEYNRDTEVKKAFEDGLNRQEGYSRGYIRW